MQRNSVQKGHITSTKKSLPDLLGGNEGVAFVSLEMNQVDFNSSSLPHHHVTTRSQSLYKIHWVKVTIHLPMVKAQERVEDVLSVFLLNTTQVLVTEAKS